MDNANRFNVMMDETPFGEDQIRRVWEKAVEISPNSQVFPPGIRIDVCGALICFEDYGRRDREYGWEIDHIIPRSAEGSDRLENLQPLHWKNNVFKGEQTDNLLCCYPVPGLSMMIWPR